MLLRRGRSRLEQVHVLHLSRDSLLLLDLSHIDPRLNIYQNSQPHSMLASSQFCKAIRRVGLSEKFNQKKYLSNGIKRIFQLWKTIHVEILLEKSIFFHGLPACFRSSVAIMENRSDNVSNSKVLSERLEFRRFNLGLLKESKRRISLGLFTGGVLSYDDIETALFRIFQCSFAALFMFMTLNTPSSLNLWHSAIEYNLTA